MFHDESTKAVCSSAAVCMTSVPQDLESITENLTQLDSNMTQI